VNRNISPHWIQVFKESDLIMLDDPQVSGLCPIIKRENPSCKVMYRSHIEIRSDMIDENPNSSQSITWNYIWSFIKHADAFIAHPVPAFVPANVPRDRLVYMGAYTDPLDGLNKPLSTVDISYYLGLFRRICIDQNVEGQLDLQRGFLIQIARFDPSKGINDLILTYKHFRKLLSSNPSSTRMTDDPNGSHSHNQSYSEQQQEKEEANETINHDHDDSPSTTMLSEHGPPQLVICGMGAIDDPESTIIYEETKTFICNHISDEQIRKDILVVRIPHIDQILNALLQSALLCFQLSTHEGYEVKITEAIMKGIPVIVYDSGGMPLQVRQSVTGWIVPRGDYQEAALRAFTLLTNAHVYKQCSQACKQLYERTATSPFNIIDALQIAYKLWFDPTAIVDQQQQQ